MRRRRRLPLTAMEPIRRGHGLATECLWGQGGFARWDDARAGFVRTHGYPLGGRPSVPWTPLAGLFGFVPLPPEFFAFQALATASYPLLVRLLKWRFMRAGQHAKPAHSCA